MSRRPPARPGRRPRSGRKPRFQPRHLPDALTVERLSHDGRGIVRWQGKTLFVAGALSGESVRVLLEGEQSRYAEGSAAEVLTPAPERQPPPCPHFRECGGCQMQHVRPDAQLAFKQQALLDQLSRWGGVVPRQVAPAIESPSEGYRHRARLGVWTDKRGQVTLGFRRRGQRELVSIGHCDVLAPALNTLIEPLNRWLSGLQARGAISHIELILASEGPALVLREIKTLKDADREALATALPAVPPERIWRQINDQSTLLTLGGEPCDPRLSYELPEFDLSLAFHPQDFTQVNAEVNRRMVRQAMDWLAPQPGEQVLDLFCGIGNFTLPLARSGARVLGLEGAASMVSRGEENARRNHLEASFAQANLADPSPAMRRRWGTPEAVLIDPPREGAREVLDTVIELRPGRLVYVSCNPATLARDAAELAKSGYDLQSVGVLDMFPHTEHVESMALFERR